MGWGLTPSDVGSALTATPSSLLNARFSASRKEAVLVRYVLVRGSALSPAERLGSCRLALHAAKVLMILAVRGPRGRAAFCGTRLTASCLTWVGRHLSVSSTSQPLNYSVPPVAHPHWIAPRLSLAHSLTKHRQARPRRYVFSFWGGRVAQCSISSPAVLPFTRSAVIIFPNVRELGLFT